MKILGAHTRDDSEIAGVIQAALKWDVIVPAAVTAKVQSGLVTLEGQVHWNLQREGAERTMKNITGVVGISNLIAPKAQTSIVEVKEKVRSALQRQANADANSIHVEASGGKVTLTGHASSWSAMENAPTRCGRPPELPRWLTTYKCGLSNTWRRTPRVAPIQHARDGLVRKFALPTGAAARRGPGSCTPRSP